MEMTIALIVRTTREHAKRLAAVESVIAEIRQHAQQQTAFNENVRASITGLANEIEKHQNNFREVGRIFQNHEEHMRKKGAASNEMAQYINALIQDSENKTLWIGNLMRESRAQTQVLQQHELGLHVQAEVIKIVANQQQQHQPQSQTVAGSGPTVTVVDEDGTDQDFHRRPAPQSGPPDKLAFGLIMEPPQTPERMDIVPLN